MAQKSRSIWGSVLKNFVNSLRPKQIEGNLMGSDYFGNKFYEIPANPALGKRRSNRWFVPKEKDDFMQEMPGEWESWLRGRRQEPPTDEEVKKNYAIMQMKKKNAVAVEAKAGKMTPLEKGMETFPKRRDYEMIPGTSQNNKK